MPLPVLARLVARTLEDGEHTSIDFIWHGGEPTVLPMTFYEKALYLQARLRRTDQQVQNILQTNGTRLTSEWVQFLKNYQFGVGVSLDGPALVHNQQRRFPSGGDSFTQVIDGIRRLQDRGLDFTLLMVIDQDTLGLGADCVFDFLLEQNIKRISCIAAKPVNVPKTLPGTPAQHYSSPKQMAGFLGRLFDRWLQHGDEEIEIRELRAIMNRLSGDPPYTCTLAGGCLGRYFLVEPQGQIAHCDLFLGDPSYTLGNVQQNSFAEIRDSPALLALRTKYNESIMRMRECSYFSVCNGWCPHERYLSIRHNPHHQENCCGLSDLIAHINSRIQHVKNQERHAETFRLS